VLSRAAAIGPLLALAGCALALDESTLTGGAPSTCPLADSILCEGFEDGLTPGLWRYPTGSDPATVSVVEEDAARGRRALAVAIDEIDADLAEQRGEITADLPIAESYGFRMFAFLPEGAANPARVLKIAQASPPLSGVQLLLDGDAIEIHVGLTGASRRFPASLPIERWFCLTGELLVATEGSVSVAIDDQPIGTFEGDTSTPDGDPPYGALTVGLSFPEPAAPQPALTARFDDVVATTAAVTCAD
jgi:hypothetical protein